MIEFQSVTKIYHSSSGGKPIFALRDVSFKISKGEFVSIVGRSGAGKTTLLKLLIAEEKPNRGQIFFEGCDISKIKPEKLPEYRRKIGVVFQDYKLLPSKTTSENIAYPLEVLGKREEEIAKDMAQVLEIVDLTSRSNLFPEELSGGERQRAAIARALIHRPQVILADEPTGNLDPYQTQEIIELLLKINQMGTTVILATHHKEIIDALGKRVISLEEGRIIRDEEKGRFIL